MRQYANSKESVVTIHFFKFMFLYHKKTVHAHYKYFNTYESRKYILWVK